MSLEDSIHLIDESKKFLEPYKIYGKMIIDGLAQLDNLEKLIIDGKIHEALTTSRSMCDQIAGYRAFVPQLADNLEKVMEILKNSC